MKKFILLLLSLFWLGKSAEAQFFTSTDYVGAMDDKNNWAEQWTNFNPNFTDYPEGEIKLSGSITTTKLLTNNKVYILSGDVYVKNGAMLIIEPGTIIRCEPKSTLIITRGSKIRALGTVEKPVIFTSNSPPTKRPKGDWGGIFILGKGRVSFPGGEAVMEGYDKENKDHKYGGDDDDDDSGVIRYTRVEFAGTPDAEDKHDNNGIAFCAVGESTKIEYVQVSHSGDDSFEWFGGKVNAKYLISVNATDDDYDVNFGYRGNLQFGIAVRDHKSGNVKGSSSIESDGYAESNDVEPFTSPNFSNFTFIGAYGENPGEAGLHSEFAINIRYNSFTSVYNSIFVGYRVGLAIQGRSSELHAMNDMLQFKNNILTMCQKPTLHSEKSSWDMNSWFSETDNWNKYFGKPEAKILRNHNDENKPDFRLVDSSPYLKSANFKSIATNTNKGSQFFDRVNFIGAFGKDNWIEEWTDFSGKANYPATNAVIEGKITANTRWVASKTYLMKGIVEVEEGVTLTIEAGTVIRCDKASRATLILKRGAKIDASGTKQKPIVFASNEAVGKRQRGDWGGIVILGGGKVNTAKKMALFDKLPSGYEFGEGLQDLQGGDDTGIFKYVRIEHAGSDVMPNKKLCALTMGAVIKIHLHNVQVSFSAEDAFDFLGGKADAKYLVSYYNAGDDFSPDFGYSGKIQYGLIVRDPITADKKGVNAIESEVHSNINSNNAVTQAVISNITAFGPQKEAKTQINLNYKNAVHLSNKSAVSVLNSVFVGYPTGVFIDGKFVEAAAVSQELRFKNNLMVNCAAAFKTSQGSQWNGAEWFNKAENNNKIITGVESLKLKDPYNALKPDFMPADNSALFKDAVFD